MSQKKSKIKLSGQAIMRWIQAHLKAVAALVVIFIILLVSVPLFFQWQKKQNKKIYGELYSLQMSLQKAGVKSNDKNYRVANANPYNWLTKTENKKKLIYSPEMVSLAQSFEQKIKTYQSRKAGAVFAIDLANFYNLHNKKEKAKNLLLPFAQAKKSSSIYHLASFQLATYYMDNKQCDEALPLWKNLIDNKRAGYIHQEAHIQSALCYEQQKNYTEAKNHYNLIAKKSLNRFELKKIKQRLYLMTLKQKLESK